MWKRLGFVIMCCLAVVFLPSTAWAATTEPTATSTTEPTATAEPTASVTESPTASPSSSEPSPSSTSTDSPSSPTSAPTAAVVSLSPEDGKRLDALVLGIGLCAMASMAALVGGWGRA